MKNPDDKYYTAKELGYNASGDFITLSTLSLSRSDKLDKYFEVSEVSFPVSAFPVQMQVLIEDKFIKHALPPEFQANSILSAVSTVLGNKVKLEIDEDWSLYGTSWFYIIGSSGAKKSPTMSYYFKPIEDMTTIDKQYYTTNTTLEGLQSLLSESETGVCIKVDELLGLTNSFNEYKSKGSDVENWLQIHENKPIYVNRADKRFAIENTFVTIIGGIQNDRLGDFLTEKLLSNGFAYRFLGAISNVPIRRDLDHIIDPINYSRYKEAIVKLSNLPVRDYKLAFSPDAFEYFKTLSSMYEDMRIEYSDSIMETAYNKADNHLAKISILLHMLDFGLSDDDKIKTEISEHTLTCAYTITHYYLDVLKHLNKESINLDRQIREYIESYGSDGCPRKDIVDRFQSEGSASVATIDRRLKNMQPMKIKTLPGKQGRYVLNKVKPC